MTEKPPKPSNDAEKARYLSRWENEGGAKAAKHDAQEKDANRPRDPTVGEAHGRFSHRRSDRAAKERD
jgi:hypothetical protein